MADSLGAVLAGINNGVGNGLEIYKTLQGEERQKREDRYRSMRDSTLDARYEAGVKTADARYADGEADEDAANALAASQYKDAQTRQSLRDIADDKHRAEQLAIQGRQAAATQARADATAGVAAAKIQQNKEASSITRLGEVYNGQDGQRNFAEQVNATPQSMLSAAHHLGFTGATAEQVDGLRLLPVNGGYVLGKPGADGKMAMWDADNDPSTPDEPKQGHFFPERLVAGLFGGSKGILSSDTATTRGSMGDGVAANVAKVNAATPELEARAAGQGRQASDARAAVAAAETAPLGAREALEQERVALDSIVSDSRGGPRSRGAKPLPADYDARRAALDAALYKANGSPQINPRGNQYNNPTQGAIPTLTSERAARAEAITSAKAHLGNVTNEQGITAQRLAQVPTAAGKVEERWGVIKTAIDALPFDQQKDALLATRETYNKSPELAARHPGKNYKDATAAQQKESTAFIDRLVGATDFKTASGPQGKMIEVPGGEANLRAVLSAMSGERLAAMSDHTGSMEGALQKATQGAMNIGKPEAIPYLLYGDANGIDSAGAVELMQDKALMGVKDQGERFKLAADAMDLVKTGKAKTPVAALGMVLQGR